MTARLSAEQRNAFARDGYLVVPSVVTRAKVGAALQAINHWLDTGYDSAQRPIYHARTFAPCLVADPLIMGLLLDSPAFDLAAALVGRPLERPAEAQIALRFPVAPGTQSNGPEPHIDGVPSPHNGVPSDGELHGFTVLAGVLLSDLPEPGHGNFTVWPGSHMAVARWFSQRASQGRRPARVDNPDEFFRETAAVAYSAAQPVAVTGCAGDLILAHYLLMHGVGNHQGPGIRYAAFFRVYAEGRHQLGDDLFTDPWTEWDAMRASSA